MDFLELSKFLEGLAQMKETEKKVKHLTRYFNHFREWYKSNDKNLDPGKSNNGSIFSLARFFLPQKDKKRRVYNLQGHTLARVFARTLGLDKNSVDGKKLLEYKNPEMSPDGGNLGNVVFSVMSTRCGSTQKSPSISELNNVLDQLAKSPENNINLEGQRKILQTFIPRLTPLEGKWLARILLKYLGLGLTTKQIIACIHPEAKELYAKTGNLEAVCIQLDDPNTEINESSVQLFQPFKPMLCARLNSLEGTSKSKSSRAEPATFPAPPFIVETKWDGDRYQIHYDSTQPPTNRWRYFSRIGLDFSSIFNRTLTPRLTKCLKPCESFILDGEMMAWNKFTGTFSQKGSNVHVKFIQPDDPNHCTAFVAFDIVYFNGESLLNRPLQFRMDILKLVAEPQEGVFYLSEQKVVQSKEEVMEALNEAVDNLQEGLVVKDLQSFYEIGERQNSWLKIKPEFFSEYSLADLDLIILGGYYTESVRKAPTISHYLVGLLDNSELGKEKFYPVTRVGPGCLRFFERDKLLHDLEPHFTREEDPSSNVLFEGHKRPDFYINPKKSVVVQVKATEIMHNESYALKYTLRFARIVLVRRDKSWQDILTLKEFHEIRVNYGGKFAKRNDDIGLGSTTKKPQVVRDVPRVYKNIKPQNSEEAPEKTEKSISKVSAPSKYFTISNSYKTRSTRQAAPPHYTVCKSGRKAKILRDIFKSRVFCVIGSSDWKSTMENKIIQNGGEIVQNPTSDMFAIVAENVSAKVDKFIQKGQYDVLQGSWILKCIESGQILKILPDDIFAAKPETGEELDKDFDIFGDSYREKKSSFDTKKLLEKIMADEPDQESDTGSDDTIYDVPTVPLKKRVLEELDPMDADKIRKFNFLEDCKIAFRGEIHPQDLFMYKQNILFYGGQWAEDEGEDGVTHVVAWDENSPTKRKQLSAFVVKPKWLLDCLERKTFLDELNYMTY